LYTDSTWFYTRQTRLGSNSFIGASRLFTLAGQVRFTYAIMYFNI
jgi:hypothetical protein